MQAVTSQTALQMTVTFAAGMLTAVSYDANKNAVHNHSVETVGSAYAIELVAKYPGETIYADGQGVALIEARVVDATGRRVPSAKNMITFAVSGDGVVYGVGNGDPACHEADKGESRSAFHGKKPAAKPVYRP